MKCFSHYCKTTFIRRHDIISRFRTINWFVTKYFFASKFCVVITTVRKRLVCGDKNLAKFSRSGIKGWFTVIF